VEGGQERNPRIWRYGVKGRGWERREREEAGRGRRSYVLAVLHRLTVCHARTVLEGKDEWQHEMTILPLSH
jgi:hypothetical protein